MTQDSEDEVNDLERLAVDLALEVRLLLKLIPAVKRRLGSRTSKERLRRVELNLLEIRDFLKTEKWGDAP